MSSFFCFRWGLPDWTSESGAPFRNGIGDEQNTPETTMVSGVIFFVAACLPGFARSAADFRLFYSLWNGVGDLEHRHILLSARAVENGLVVAMEVHHGS